LHNKQYRRKTEPPNPLGQPCPAPPVKAPGTGLSLHTLMRTCTDPNQLEALYGHSDDVGELLAVSQANLNIADAATSNTSPPKHNTTWYSGRIPSSTGHTCPSTLSSHTTLQRDRILSLHFMIWAWALPGSWSGYDGDPGGSLQNPFHRTRLTITTPSRPARPHPCPFLPQMPPFLPSSGRAWLNPHPSAGRSTVQMSY
jgi:hypothetical protein